jgi:carboxypeptidase T
MKALIILSVLFTISAAQAQVATNRKYKDVSEKIHKIANTYPQNAEVFTLGFSDAGIAIEGLKIGHGETNNLVVATHHGNEYGSTEIALGAADDLAASPIAHQTIFIIPVLNIDGYNYRNRYEKVNGQYIDQNRDYPGPCATEGPFHSRSTQALADFIDKNNIVVSATLHTYWPVVVYPWGISTHDVETPYISEFSALVEAATYVSKYQTGNNTQLIYPADGTFEDYAYWKHGIWSILFEVGNSHSPGIQDLQTMVSANVPGIRKMFEIAPTKRATDYAFKGRCDSRLMLMDLHIE